MFPTKTVGGESGISCWLCEDHNNGIASAFATLNRTACLFGTGGPIRQITSEYINAASVYGE
jgi:hypothetical protein